jgi:hypothetical protein
MAVALLLDLLPLYGGRAVQDQAEVERRQRLGGSWTEARLQQCRELWFVELNGLGRP